MGSRILLVTVLVAASATDTHAQVLTDECTQPAISGPERASLEHDGTPGFWIRRDLMLGMLCELRVLEVVRPRVTLLEERLTIRDEQVVRLRSVVELANTGEARALDGLRLAEDVADRLRRQQSSIVRSPALWLVVGVVVGALLLYFGAHVAGTI